MTPPQLESAPQRASLLICLMIAGASTVSLIFGHAIRPCANIFHAMMWTVVVAGLFAPLIPEYLLAILVSIGAITVMLRAFSANAWVRQNISLLAFLLPVALVLVGYTVARITGPLFKCSMGF